MRRNKAVDPFRIALFREAAMKGCTHGLLIGQARGPVGVFARFHSHRAERENVGILNRYRATRAPFGPLRLCDTPIKLEAVAVCFRHLPAKTLFEQPPSCRCRLVVGLGPAHEPASQIPQTISSSSPAR